MNYLISFLKFVFEELLGGAIIYCLWNPLLAFLFMFPSLTYFQCVILDVILTLIFDYIVNNKIKKIGKDYNDKETNYKTKN